MRNSAKQTVHLSNDISMTLSTFSLPRLATQGMGTRGRRRTLTAAGFVLTLAAIFMPARAMEAQLSFHFPAPVPVAGPAQIQTVTVTLPNSGTIDAVQVLTQGSPNLDFNAAAGVPTCVVGRTYLAGQSCTLGVSFQAKAPGQRHGAVVLTQGSSPSTVIGTEFLEGDGTGGLSLLIPGLIDTVAGEGTSWHYTQDDVPATSTGIYLPQGEVTDAAGNLYIADTSNNRIRRVDATGKHLITTVAGSAVQGYAGDNGPGIRASLNVPTALALDGAGNLYLADSANFRIRMLNTLTGMITTIAGTGVSGNQGDTGPATSARLSTVGGLALDTQHSLYVSDSGNNVIRKIDLSTGIITRFAGTGAEGGANGQALTATFAAPQGINFGRDGSLSSLYIADQNNNVIRKIDSTGLVDTIAGGRGTGSNYGDGGLALSANLNLPVGVAIDPAGNLYIADAGNNRVRKVNAGTQVITTIAGNGVTGSETLGDGSNSDGAQLYNPASIYLDGQGNLFIGDLFHNRMRKVSANASAWKYDPMRVGRISPVVQLQHIENDGNADLKLSALPDLLATTPPSNASIDTDPTITTCALPQTLTPEASCALGIHFAPTELSNANGDPIFGSIPLTSDAANSPDTIGVSGKVLSVDPTKTTISSDPKTSSQGAPVTLSAHVTTQGTQSSLTGSVKFLDGTALLGSGNLDSSANAVFTTSSLGLGSHSITAVYSGDQNNDTSTSKPPLIQSVKQATTLTLQSSANPSFESQAVVLTATISAGGAVPTGQIAFLSDNGPLGIAPLNAAGTATLTVSTLTIGTHSLIVTYGGDTNNGPSQSNTLTQTVQGQGSSVTLTTSNAVVAVGASVAFSVQVTGTNTAVATGAVVFKDGGAAIGTATLNGAGAASFATSGLTPGLHGITAEYKGDDNYAGSTSALLTETIQQLATITAVSSSVNPSPAGAALVLTAAVSATASNPTGGVINGTVTFLNGGVALGSGALSAGGLATLQIATVPLGQNSITAVYGGNANYLASTAAPIVQTVQQAWTATVVTSSAEPVIAEDPLTLSATVTTNGGRATGIVLFNDGGTSLGQGTLNAQGVATIVTSTLTVGQHKLSAQYAGDTQNLASGSSPLTQDVLLRPTTDVLTSSATSLNGGQQITLISVVQWTGPLVPTGAVTFQSGGTALGLTIIDGSGVATLTINPQTGLNSITATYSGDSVYLGSTSALVSVTVGVPPQFTLAATPNVMSLKSLEHSNVDLTATSEKGFSDLLSLGCSGLPRAATCTFSTDHIQLAADGSSVVHVVVDTGSPLTAGSVARNEAPLSSSPLPSSSQSSSSLVALCGLPLGAFFCVLFRKVRWLRSSLGGLLLLLCALGSIAGLSGCGTMTTNGTPAGVYNFQITASAQGAGVVQAVNMKLTVTK